MSLKIKYQMEERLADYDRGALRSAFASLFWAVICRRKKDERMTLTVLSDRLGVDKSLISRWFSGDRPNWRINTIADLSRILDVSIFVYAKDRKTGTIFSPAGTTTIETIVSEVSVGLHGATKFESVKLQEHRPVVYIDESTKRRLDFDQATHRVVK